MAVKKVFLSYASADRKTVDRLKKELEAAGVPLWVDHEQLVPGEKDWGVAIERAIPQCQAMIYVASPHAKASKYVVNELEIAERHNIPIIPFWIAGADWLDAVPFGFPRLQYIDARTDYPVALHELLPRLAKEPVLAQTFIPPPIPVPPVAHQTTPVRARSAPGQVRNRVIAITSIVLVFALVSIGIIVYRSVNSVLKWTIVSSLSPGYNDDLNGIATVNASDAWAVGHYLSGPGVNQALIERWNGSAWSVVSSPSPGSHSNSLSGIAAVDATDAWAVGTYDNGSSFQTLIEHWNGSIWSVVPSPNPGSNNNKNQLRGITVVDANDAWAVGTYNNGSSFQTLIERWNGSTWSVVSSPSPSSITNNSSGIANGLTGITAMDTNDAWVVGEYFPNPSIFPQTLIEHWNGSTWSVVPSPSPGSGNDSPYSLANELNNIAALDATDVWAVGFYRNGSGLNRTLIEHWNGSSWSDVSSPNPGTVGNLSAISIVDANDAWAVGTSENDIGNPKSLILRWGT